MKKYSLFIGIDISKLWFDAAITFDGEKATMIHKQFDNNPKGFKLFLTWIEQNAKENNANSYTLICMEHTGIYTLPFCAFLEEYSFDYVLESALRIQKSMGIRRGKNDKADAMDIAEYIEMRHKKLKVSKLQAVELMKLKSFLSFRSRLVKQRAALKSSKKEYSEYTPAQLYESAIEEDSVELIKFISQKIKSVEKKMMLIIKENEALQKLYDLVCSVIGVGQIVGITLIVHTNKFKAFANARKFATYIGIVPFGKSSGTSTNKPAKVSKLGHRKIKALITNSVGAAIQHDQQIKSYYLRKVAEGKNKFSVQNAIKNKIIHRVFAVVNRGTPFVVLHNFK